MIKFFKNLFLINNIRRINFRQDINGLRALAVLSVIIYHSEVGFLTGGFLGVDIFFVISGYLITNIIVSELNEDVFKFSNFYLKRIKRILPALFSTLFFTSIFAFLFFTPKVLIEYVKSLIPATFFYSNLYFSNLDFYNSEPARYMPLIHTWSLAIEEQFYIIFPVLIFLVYKYLKKYLLTILIFVILFSIYLNTTTDSLDKFYLIEFRIWELLLGSACMVIEQNIKKIKKIELFGFTLMTTPLFYFNDDWITDIEPKLITLAGVSIILIFNTQSSFLTKMLSIAPLSKVGTWSFSIYLLHQPIYSFYRIINEKNQPVSWLQSSNSRETQHYFELMFVTLIIIFLSMLNYRIIEKKYLKNFNKRKSLSLPAVATIITIFSFVTLQTEGYQGRWSDNLQNQKAIEFQKKNNYDLIINGKTCHILDPEEIIENLCVINNNSLGTPILVLGDSMSRTVITPLSKELKDHQVTFITGDSCIFLIEMPNPRCKRSDREAIRKLLLEVDNSIIIYIADLWQKVEDGPNQLESIKALDLVNTFPQTINYLSENNQVILLTQIPTFKPSIPNLILEGKEVVKISYQEWKNLKGVKILEEIYKELNQKNLHFVKVDEIFCDSFEQEYCVGNTDSKIFYSDSKHLSIEGAELVVLQILNVLDYAIKR